MNETSDEIETETGEATAPVKIRAPRIAVVGRPNVGKSTLFNRLVGKKLAIVDDTPGVTRDVREAKSKLRGHDMTLLDTAGFENVRGDKLEARMRAGTEQAVLDSDIVLFVYDARAGVTPLDRIFADFVRKTGKPTVLVANKVESSAADIGITEGYSLGMGDPIEVSAEHNIGIVDLDDAIELS
ncbi:MAG: GTPase, partial [Pseudomonadota bacterium]